MKRLQRHAQKSWDHVGCSSSKGGPLLYPEISAAIMQEGGVVWVGGLCRGQPQVSVILEEGAAVAS